MVRPTPQHQAIPTDVDLVSFINDFLFSQHEGPSSSPSALRRQRTPPRSKRYKSMWRAAATSVIVKRRASQETHLRPVDRPLKHLPSSVSVHSASFLSADAQEVPSCASLAQDGDLALCLPQLDSHSCLASDGDLATSHPQGQINNNDITINVDATSPLATTRGFNKDKPHETTRSVVIPKHGSRKPPRPPKVGILRSGSYRAIRLKTATRKAVVDPVRIKKQKIYKSTSNATFIWALIITICFVSIMLMQGLFGNNSEHFSVAIDRQKLGDVVSSSPSQMGPLL